MLPRVLTLERCRCRSLFGLLVGMAFLAGCNQDETARAYGASDRVWTMVELDGQPFGETATLTFPDAGRVSGQAPCNRYFASMTAPYPWFQADAISSTKRACSAIAAETIFLTALAEMTQSEISGDVLILANEDAREMVFTATD